MKKILEEAYKDYPGDIEIVWRYSRSCYMLFEDLHGDEKPDILRKGVGLAQEAIKLDTNHFAGHKWFAINLSALGDFESINEKIKNGFLIREHLDYALKCNAEDATVLFAIGKWCFAVANVSGVVRTIAKSILSALPESSFDEAITFFKKVEDIVQDPKKRSLLS